MEIDSGHTAWLLVSAALVLLMTPGLALFYGGMTRAKSVLNMMLMSFSAIAVVSVLWVLYGYSLSYGDGGGLSALIGGLDKIGLAGMESTATDGIPDLLDAAFQMMFAVITVALISGAIADRAKFGAWVLFAGLWATLVYFPVAHWVWGDGGWIGEFGTLDFAGGTAVHVNSGAAALALAIVLGRRKGWRREPMRPHNLPIVLLGAALLWFGWFGFNAGSAYAADGTASLAFINTQVATATAVGAWILVEKLRDGHSTTLGAASGAIAGLVGITPAADVLSPVGSIALGAITGAVCAFAVGLKYRLRYDDSLDVVGVHLVGGAVGSFLISMLAVETGLLYGNGAGQILPQVVGVLGVAVYSFVIALLLGKVIDLTMGFRISEEAEVTGVDITSHAETGYDLGSVHASGVTADVAPAVPDGKKVDAK